MNIKEEIQNKIREIYESGTSEGAVKAWRTRKSSRGDVGMRWGREVRRAERDFRKRKNTGFPAVKGHEKYFSKEARERRRLTYLRMRYYGR